jgi:D-alanine--poly(phosphoribitol) ligase subunit 1
MKSLEMNIIQYIDHWASLAPSQPAQVSESRTLCYGELAHFSDILAAYLLEHIANDGLPVAVFGHKEPEMLVGFLGVIKSGHPYIPIDSAYPAQRVERIMQTAQASLLLTPEKISEILRNGAAAKINLAARKIEPTDPWYIIFTSGSTGDPKGVVITAGCLQTFLDWMLGEHSFKELGETFLNQAPFSFDLSVMDLYLSLVTGGTLFSITHEMIDNPRLLFQNLAVSNASVWVSTPSFAQMCLAEKTFTTGMLPNLGMFLFCGETLAPETASGLLDRFSQAEVWNTYGPTETTVATTSICINKHVLKQYSPLPVGYPMPSGKIVALAENGQPAPEGERGEIVIAGSNVSPGYIGRPDLTAHAFFEYEGLHAYRTGDWGRFRDGLLFFEGRMDSQIKLHGYRIELGDVENNLRSMPNVRDAVAIPALKAGVPDWLAAFVVLEEPLSVSEFEETRSLKQKLALKLPSYMIPRKFFFLDVFPMTTNGKADRRKLAEKLV